MKNDLGFSFIHKSEKQEEDKNSIRIIVKGGLPDYIPDGPAAFLNMAIPEDYTKAWEEYMTAQAVVETLTRKIQELETHYMAVNQAKYATNPFNGPFNGDSKHE